MDMAVVGAVADATSRSGYRILQSHGQRPAATVAAGAGRGSRPGERPRALCGRGRRPGPRVRRTH